MCYGCNKCNKCGKFNEDSNLYIPPPKVVCPFCDYAEVDLKTGICPACGAPVVAAPGRSSDGRRAVAHDGAGCD